MTRCKKIFSRNSQFNKSNPCQKDPNNSSNFHKLNKFPRDQNSNSYLNENRKRKSVEPNKVNSSRQILEQAARDNQELLAKLTIMRK
jgi:hypothetical protein